MTSSVITSDTNMTMTMTMTTVTGSAAAQVSAPKRNAPEVAALDSPADHRSYSVSARDARGSQLPSGEVPERPSQA